MLNSSLKNFQSSLVRNRFCDGGGNWPACFYQTFGAEAYRKYHNNLMTSAYVFFNNQREFTLSDLDMVVNKSGFNSSFGDREKGRYENVISGNMQLGEARDQRNARVHYHEHARNPTLQRHHSSGAVDEATLKYAIQKARGG